jgi:hypothetical protein
MCILGAILALVIFMETLLAVDEVVIHAEAVATLAEVPSAKRQPALPHRFPLNRAC